MKQTRRDPNDNSFYCECKGCWWWRGGSGVCFCHYCHETGQPRGVLPKDCYKHPGTPYMTAAEGRKFEKEKRSRGKKTIPQSQDTACDSSLYTREPLGGRKEKKMANHGNYSTETKEAAVKAVLLDKEPQSVVCERFCIAKSTLGKWVTDAKKQQKAFIDYAEEIEAEQSRPSVPAVQKQSGKEDFVEKKTTPQSQDTACDSSLTREPLGEENELDGIADRLCNDINDMEKIMRNFEKLELINDREKQTLEKLFARANGFVLGIDYRR